MAAGTQRFFGSKIQSASVRRNTGYLPRCWYGACSAPASDYRERFDKDYWSEVQRHVRPSPPVLPASSSFSANGGGSSARRNVCNRRTHSWLRFFSEIITEGTEKKPKRSLRTSSNSGPIPKESIWSARRDLLGKFVVSNAREAYDAQVKSLIGNSGIFLLPLPRKFQIEFFGMSIPALGWRTGGDE